jgi:sugar O-acyltransferase (sialic acid O-acetyltransferase NeuD family)
MAEAFEVLIPLLNPNEPEVQIVEILTRSGQKVRHGDVLCTVETTKSSNEITAEQSGYVVALVSATGDKLRAGERLCWLAEEEGWQPPQELEAVETQAQDALPSGLRITRPALELAEENGLSLEAIPTDSLVTEAVVKRILGEQGDPAKDLSESALDPSALVIYGGGGHGKALIDLVRAMGTYRIVGIVDDGIKAGVEIMGVPVLGGGEQLHELAQRGIRQAINAVGGIGDVNRRIQVFKRLMAQRFEFPALIHPTAWVEPGASLDAGVQVFPHAYIGSDAKIGLGVIVNTSAVVSHDCTLDDYVNIAPGALVAGNVTIGEGVLVGMGVTINLNVSVGAGAKIGNSAVVKDAVPEGQVIRAGSIWPQD